MLTPRFVFSIFTIGLMVLGAGALSGQTYPNKPLRIISGSVGSTNDLTTRLTARGISGPLGQPVIVDNRPTVVGTELLPKAPPDGYTLLNSGAILWIRPLLENTPYDPVRDFAPITLTDRSANVLVVTLSLPVNSLKELIALAKAKPGELNYARSATGSTGHLTAELFKSMAGVNMVGVIYKGTAGSINDLISGQVHMAFGNSTAVMPHVKTGRLRALAVTGAQPSALFPGLPTIAASGLPGFDAASIAGFFAPAKTPGPIINRLNQEIARVLNQADVKQKFIDSGIEAVTSSPEEFAAAVKSEMVKWGKVIKGAGIKAD